ncbi:MAG: hypothetical protein IKT46_08920 [Clostridia bacterium]|nr:hypothetical protein [Clostridia bacterium]
MKELKEYKAEIFRRSEEKIKERKKQTKRSIILCTAFCLFFAASALFIPPMLTDNADGATAEQDHIIIDDADGAEAVDTGVPAYIRVEITEEGKTTADIDDTNKIAKIEQVINYCFSDNYLYYDVSERQEKAEIRDESHTEYSMSESITENDDEGSDAITITLTAADGYKKTLIINDNILIDFELGVDTDVTESRLEELKALFS